MIIRTRRIGANDMRVILLGLILIASNAYAEPWPLTKQDCLAANIYHEARGESLAGQYMVAYVTMNRVESSRYPNTICAVVKEYKQFSWYNPKISKYPKDSDAWDKACSVALKFLLDKPISKIDLSEGAIYYHATYVSPEWAARKTYIGRVGIHLFYR